MAVLFELDKSKLDERINEAALRALRTVTHLRSSRAKLPLTIAEPGRRSPSLPVATRLR